MAVPLHAAVLGLAAAALFGCSQDRLQLIPQRDQPRTPPAIRDACSLTELKCSRCHDLQRIEVAHHALVDWPVYVEKMRRQPGSGITVADTKIILKCLEHLSALQRHEDQSSL